jgi:hypothetical protein
MITNKKAPKEMYAMDLVFCNVFLLYLPSLKYLYRIRQSSNVLQLSRTKTFQLAIILLTLAGSLTHFGVGVIDHHVYYPSVRWIVGEVSKDEILPISTLRLFTPFFSAIFYKMGLSLADSFAIVNVVLSIFVALTLYHLSKLLLNDEKLAFYTATFFSSNYTFLYLSAGTNTDIASWLFLTLGFYSTFKHYSKGKPLITAIVLAVGMFAKETTYILLLYLFLYELIHDRNWKSFIIVTAITLLPYFAWQLIIQVSYFHWYIPAILTYSREKGVSLLPIPQLIIKRFVWAFLPVITFFPFGFLSEHKKENIRFYYLSFFSIFSALVVGLYGAYTLRSYFTLFPAVLPLCALGMRSFYEQLHEKPIFNRIRVEWFEYFSLILFIALGYYFEYATYKKVRVIGF